MISTLFSKPESDSLCKEIAKKSKGVCFLGFSGGKDSLCAWIALQRYFPRIIPFHCASWPGMRYLRDSLDYYQYMFNTRILRLIGEDYPMALTRMMYQDYETCIEVDEDPPSPDYSKLDVLENLRYAYNLPNAWCAFGIAASDSIDRQIYCKKTGGQNPQNKTFYPCWDWSRAEIIDAIRESGLKLNSTYRYINRTLGNVPGILSNEILKAHYPDDWQHLLALYPLAEAKTVREKILDREWAAAKVRAIESNGGTANSELVGSDTSDDSCDDSDDMDGNWLEDNG